jgi:hypothetical protein
MKNKKGVRDEKKDHINIFDIDYAVRVTAKSDRTNCCHVRRSDKKPDYKHIRASKIA